MNKMKQFAAQMKLQINVLNNVRIDSRTPWLAKIIILIVVAYAISPIDLIPDFIPVLGLLDDLVLLPLGIYLAMKLVPKEVWQDCKLKAQKQSSLPSSFYGSILIVSCWVVLALVVIYWLIYT
jgi:uncharacterized membrane protein YkvA (DUF1232 family)